MKTKQKKLITLVFAFVFFQGVMLLGSLSIFPSVASADQYGPCTRDQLDNVSDTTPRGCLEYNCDIAKQNGFSGNCQDVINNCNSVQWVKAVAAPTTLSSCANAFASCFAHETNNEACTDKDVLALAGQCNVGNVDAAGKAPDLGNASVGCGVDAAIEAHNQIDGGKDFTNNEKLAQQQLDNTKNQCNYGSNSTQAQCKKDVENQFNDCYSQAGGQANKLDTTKLNTCLASKANTRELCDARKGSWDDGTKKCTPPIPPDPCAGHNGTDPNNPGKCKDGSSPNDAAGVDPGKYGNISAAPGRCGEARVNIIVCSNSGENVGGAEVFNRVLKIAVLVLSFLVGVAALGGLAWASITYARAADNSGTVSEAKDMIRNIVIGLILYGFLIAIVNWLVPGAVFG